MRRAALGLAAGLALADASIVTLGLPSILVELEATVEGVALVLGVYTAALALALLPASALAAGVGAPRLGAAGIGLFALASLGCGLSGSLGMLLALRGVQALGGAAALVACFELVGGGGSGPGRRIWVGASVFGVASLAGIRGAASSGDRAGAALCRPDRGDLPGRAAARLGMERRAAGGGAGGERAADLGARSLACPRRALDPGD